MALKKKSPRWFQCADRIVILVLIIFSSQDLKFLNSKFSIAFFFFLTKFIPWGWRWAIVLHISFPSRELNYILFLSVGQCIWNTSPTYPLPLLFFVALPLQYFGHLMRRANSLEKTGCWERSRAGGEGGDRGWDGWMASPTQWTWVWVGDGQGGLVCCSPWGCKESDTTERLNWTELKHWFFLPIKKLNLIF